jgi:hypothetical protein
MKNALLINIVPLTSCFIGTVAFFWVIIQISEWQKYNWFLASFLQNYGFWGWTIVSLPISVIAFIILRKTLYKDKPESLIKINSLQINVKEKGLTMSDNSPIKIDQNNFLTIIKIPIGDYRDFIRDDNKIRIEVKELIKDNFEVDYGFAKEIHGVIIYMDVGGGLVYGGRYSKHIGTNEYAIPKIQSTNQEPYSIYRFYVVEHYFNFLRVYIEHINLSSQEVTLNVFIARHSF